MEHNSASIVTERDSRTAPEAGADDSDRLLQRLLTMAAGYRADGDVQAAMELYWLLAEEHPQTSQAATAKQALLEMANGYERRRAPFIARSIYERLETDEAR